MLSCIHTAVESAVKQHEVHLNVEIIRPCHKAAILSRGTKKALFYHAKPHPHGFHCEALGGKKSSFGLQLGTIWPPCDKGE